MKEEKKIPGVADVKKLKHFNIYNHNDVQFEPTFVSVGRQIESIAQTKPNEIAVIEISKDDTEVKTATWKDLYLKSNQLAWLLKEEGITNTSTVMICLPNTIAHILCIYAAWKNGACYLPIAPRRAHCGRSGCRRERRKGQGARADHDSALARPCGSSLR